MMQTYSGRVKAGRFFPIEGTVLPDSGIAVLIVESIHPIETEHAKNWREFLREIKECDEPLGEEFDRVMSQRVNFTRELDI